MRVWTLPRGLDLAPRSLACTGDAGSDARSSGCAGARLRHQPRTAGSRSAGDDTTERVRRRTGPSVGRRRAATSGPARCRRVDRAVPGGHRCDPRDRQRLIGAWTELPRPTRPVEDWSRSERGTFACHGRTSVQDARLWRDVRCHRAPGRRGAMVRRDGGPPPSRSGVAGRFLAPRRRHQGQPDRGRATRPPARRLTRGRRPVDL